VLFRGGGVAGETPRKKKRELEDVREGEKAPDKGEIGWLRNKRTFISGLGR